MKRTDSSTRGVLNAKRTAKSFSVRLFALLAVAACDKTPRAERRIAPRLSIDVAYVACSDSSASDTSIVFDACATSNALESTLAQPQTNTVESSDELSRARTSALVDLQWSRGGGISLDRSILVFEMLATSAPSSSAALVDLSAAYLVRAGRAQNARDLFAAANAATRAALVDKRAPSALYNRALSLDRLGLVIQAEQAWKDYLAVDAKSGWATEAKKHVATLTSTAATIPKADAGETAWAKFTSINPQLAREYAFNDALLKWGNAAIARDSTQAKAHLQLAEVIGKQLKENKGDETLLRAVSALQSAQSSEVESLARAHVAYANAQAKYLAAPSDSTGFAEARSLAVKSPGLQNWATLFLANTFVYQQRFDAGAAMLEQLIAAAQSQPFPALRARALWSLGTTRMRQGTPAISIPLFRESAGLFADIGEQENRGAVLANLAEAFSLTGDDTRALQTSLASMSVLRAFPNSQWRHNALLVASRFSTAAAFDEVAIAVQQEAVSIGERVGEKRRQVEAGINLARAYASAGRSAEAKQSLDRVASIFNDIDARYRPYFNAERQLVVSSLRPNSASTIAIAELDSASMLYESLKRPVKVLQAQTAKADLLQRNGETELAQVALSKASAIITSTSAMDAVLRRQIEAEGLRSQYSRTGRSVYGRLALARLASYDTVGALRAIEDGRALSGVSVIVSKSAATKVPVGRLVVDYAIVSDTLLTWAIDAKHTQLVRTPVTRRVLDSLVLRARRSIEISRSVDDINERLGELHALLIAPIRARLEGATDIVVVADDPIAGVPFAALYDVSRKQYLVESLNVQHSWDLASAAQKVSDKSVSVTAFVADPAFSSREFPALRRLAGAAQEVGKSASNYPGTVVVGASSATEDSETKLLQTANVVHIAAHTIMDGDRPESSLIALAPSAAHSDGALTGAELGAMNLSKLRLVILSSCESLAPFSHSNNGLSGLAQGLFAAGASGIIGSAWQVDDQQTATLMAAFHSEFRNQHNPSTALRTAQLALLKSSDTNVRSPRAWAGFRYFGN